MNITIQKKETFKIAGINAKNIELSSCPEVWKELFLKYSPEKLEAWERSKLRNVS